MEESGLFSMQDPFPQMEEHQTSQCQIQVVNAQPSVSDASSCVNKRIWFQVNDDNQMQTEEVNFDPFPHTVNDTTSMLFGDDYPLSYSYEIL